MMYKRTIKQAALVLSGMLLMTACGEEKILESKAALQETGCATMSKNVMQATLAGSWYSADPDHLIKELSGYLEKVPEQAGEYVMAVIMPHAGFAFSGQTAAYSVKAAAQHGYDRVMIVAPTHRVNMPNRASVADVTHFATPLGEVPVDVVATKALLGNPFIDYIPAAHQGENSVEMMIPILQAGMRDFELVMVVVGQLDEQGTRRLAKALLEKVDDKTLVVVSGDFTHYGRRFDYMPFPVTEAPDKLKALDMGAVDEIRKKDLPGWYSYLQRTGATICGGYSVGVLLAMLPESARVELLHYTNSGELTGDWANSVSYAAVAVTGQWPQEKTEEVNMENEHSETAIFSGAEQRALLKLARGTIEYYLQNGSKPTPEQLDVEITPAMKQVMGAFVTLHKHGQLRGCIGEILPRRELYQAVMERAVSAAFEDPRFPALRAGELDDIDVEISALTPPTPVASYRDIEVGRHGMILQKGFRSAVFLPQVAPEQGWGIEETLTHLAVKAGLRPDDWRDGCAYEVFEATVFGEKE